MFGRCVSVQVETEPPDVVVAFSVKYRTTVSLKLEGVAGSLLLCLRNLKQGLCFSAWLGPTSLPIDYGAIVHKLQFL